MVGGQWLVAGASSPIRTNGLATDHRPPATELAEWLPDPGPFAFRMVRRIRNQAALAAIVLVLLFAVTVGLYFLIVGPEKMAERAFGQKEEQVDLAILVTQIKELSRLETASMRVMHVSTVTQSYGAIPNQLMGDEMTFLAVGDVIAGVDLSLLKEDDIRYAGNGVLAIDLPPPMILVVRVDNQESRVLNRDTGLLRRADIHLETRARARAEANIRNEATRKGILQLADRNAQAKLADFLGKVGFQQIRFEQKPPPLKN